jgi:hypothetical protein
MLKKTLKIGIVLFLIGNGVFAQQWGGSTTENGVIARAGDVGIGTGNPRGKLDIWGGTLHVTGSDQNGTLVAGAMSGNAYLGINVLTNAISITPAGWVGIGTVSTGYTLDVNGSTKTKLIDINNGSSDGGRLIWRGGANGTQEYRARIAPEGFLGFFPGEGIPTTMVLTQNGSVGIGTQYPGDYKLAVNGGIVARSVKVSNSYFADYVFEPTYKLRPLSSVENFINENKHLPGMPSAKEVEKDGGFELAAMNVKLLEKVEELTLYIIAQNKKMETLEKKFETLEKKIEKLKN